MTEYTSAIDLAARLIIKKGREVIFRHLEDDVVTDPNRPWDKAAPLKGDTPTRIVMLDYEQKYIDGTNIKVKDKQGLMFAKGQKYVPTTKDLIYDKKDKKWWRIMEVEILQPGDETVMYTLQLRGA